MSRLEEENGSAGDREMEELSMKTHTHTHRHSLNVVCGVPHSECCVSVPHRPVISSYRMAPHTPPAAQTGGHQPTGKTPLYIDI